MVFEIKIQVLGNLIATGMVCFILFFSSLSWQSLPLILHLYCIVYLVSAVASEDILSFPDLGSRLPLGCLLTLIALLGSHQSRKWWPIMGPNWNIRNENGEISGQAFYRLYPIMHIRPGFIHCNDSNIYFFFYLYFTLVQINLISTELANAGFFNLYTIDILIWIILCWGREGVDLCNVWQ